MLVARCESYVPTVKLTFPLCACEWVFQPHRMQQKLRCYLDVSLSCYYVKSLMIQCPLIGERVRSDRLETWPRPPHGQYQQKKSVFFSASIVFDERDNSTQLNVVHFKAPHGLVGH